MLRRKCFAFCLAASLLATSLVPAFGQDVTVDVNGKDVPSTPKAYVANGRTVMPAQELANAIQAKLSMAENKVSFQKDLITLDFFVGEKGYRLNGAQKTYDAAAVKTGGTIAVPVRPVGENYHYDVNWLAQQQHVNIADKRPVAAYIDDVKCGDNCVGYVINGRTLLPLRAIVEALGGKVDWDDATHTATITMEDKDGNKTVVVFTLGKTVYTKDGKEVSIDQALLLINDHLYIPVRHLSDAIGKAIGWDEEAYAVYLGKGADEATARTKAYQERLAKEKAEAEKAAREKAEADRLAKENAAKEQARIEAGKKEALKNDDYVEEHITQGPDRIIGNWKGYWMIEDESNVQAYDQFHIRKAADGSYYVVINNYKQIYVLDDREDNEISTAIWHATYYANKDAYFFQIIKDSDGEDVSYRNSGIWYRIEGDTLVQVGDPVGNWNLTTSELYRF